MNNYYTKTDSKIRIDLPEDKTLSLKLNLSKGYEISINSGKNSSLNLNIVSKDDVKINSNINAGEFSKIRINNYLYTNDKSYYNYDVDAKDYSDVKINVKMNTNSQIDGAVNIESNNNTNTAINYIVIGQNDSVYNLKQRVHHIGSNSNHLMLTSGILSNNSLCSLIGEIHIDQNVKNVESRMRGKFITYDNSKMYSIPILKIWSNDVRTEHSVSSIPDSQLFNDYILSRGIGVSQSKKLFEQNLINSVIKEW